MTECIRLVPLGGLGEVGRNMMVIEYHDGQGEIARLIVDAGVEFMRVLGGETRVVIADVEYLVRNKKTIVGLLNTHGHYDHFAAIAHVMEDLGYPTIFAPPMAADLIMAQQRDLLQEANKAWGHDDQHVVYEMLYEPHVIRPNSPESVELGPFTVRWFPVTHSIPDAVGYVIGTPLGNIVHTGDFRLERTPVLGEPFDEQLFRSIGDDGVLAMLSDSTGALREGETPSEQKVLQCLDELFAKTEGRIVFTSFASHIERLQQVFDLAAKHGRRIALLGRTWETNYFRAVRLGHLSVDSGILTDPKDYDHDERLVLVCTGSQGEEGAMLARLARSGEDGVRLNRHDVQGIRIHPGDTVIYSASIIPGNDDAVAHVKGQLRDDCGATVQDVLTHPCVHASGHASAEDLTAMLSYMRPRFLLPVHGERDMLERHAELARESGVEDAVVALDGDAVEVTPDGMTLNREAVSAGFKILEED